MSAGQLPPCGIDDEELELYALGRVREPDPGLIAHFLECDLCARRMEEARLLAAEIKRALGEQKGSEMALRSAARKRRN